MSHCNLLIDNPNFSIYAFHLKDDLANQQIVDSQDHPDFIWDQFSSLGDPNKLDSRQLRDLKKYLVCYKETPPGSGSFMYDENSDAPPNYTGNIFELLDKNKFPDNQLIFAINKVYGITSTLGLKGSFVPVRFDDTYIVDFSIFTDGKDLDIKNLAYLNFNGILSPNEIRTSLGQTLQLILKPSKEVLPEEYKELAIKSVNSLFSSSDFGNITKNVVESEFFNLKIFDFNTERFPTGQLSPDKQVHIIVIFYQEKKDLMEFSNAIYAPLRNLLLYRSRVIYVFYKASESYKKAKEIYEELENHIENMINKFSKNQTNNPQASAASNLQASSTMSSTNLDNLQNELLKLSQKELDYSKLIRNIQDHLTTVNTNLLNYEISLKEIRKCKRTGNDNFQSIEEFLHRIEKISKQIQIYLNFLNPGLSLFDRANSMIGSYIQVERGKIDRKLQNTIQTIGIGIGSIGAGLATGGIVATSYALITDKDPIKNLVPGYSLPYNHQLKPNAPLYLHSFIVSVLISLSTSILVIFISWHMLQGLFNHLSHKNK